MALNLDYSGGPGLSSLRHPSLCLGPWRRLRAGKLLFVCPLAKPSAPLTLLTPSSKKPVYKPGHGSWRSPKERKKAFH